MDNIQVKWNIFNLIKKGNLSFVSIKVKLESIMLSEISQRKKNPSCYPLYVKSKKNVEFIETENRNVVARYRHVGKIRRVW